jgi:uncharacterized protein (DUF2267 family)
VHYGQIVGYVQGSCGVDLVTADRLTGRALRGLAARLMSLSAPHLAHRLPSALGSELREEDGVDELAVDRFYDDVASGARVSTTMARQAVGAVVTVLRQTMTQQDFEAVFETLPADYLELSFASQRAVDRP